MSEYNLDADLFMRVRRAIGQEAALYYLTGVYVEPMPENEGVLLIATDGRVMLVARDRKGRAPKPTIVALTLPEEARPDRMECDEGCCALAPVNYDGARLVFDLPETAPVVAVIMRDNRPWRHAIAERINGNFPNWRKVWPANAKANAKYEPRKGHQAYGISTDLISRVAGGSYIVLRPHHGGPAQQIIFDGRREIVGLIMPCDLAMIGDSAALADSLAAREDTE